MICCEFINATLARDDRTRVVVSGSHGPRGIRYTRARVFNRASEFSSQRRALYRTTRHTIPGSLRCLGILLVPLRFLKIQYNLRIVIIRRQLHASPKFSQRLCIPQVEKLRYRVTLSNGFCIILQNIKIISLDKT